MLLPRMLAHVNHSTEAFLGHVRQSMFPVAVLPVYIRYSAVD